MTSNLFLAMPKNSVWAYALKACQERLWVEATVVHAAEDGVEVDMDGLHGFVFEDKMALQEGQSLEDHVGQTLTFRVIKADPEHQCLRLSRQAVLDDMTRPQRMKKIEHVKVGSLVTGVVSRIIGHGAIVDLGDDVDGLIHVSNISEEKVGYAGKVLGVGQRVVARVLTIDEDKARISLGMKQVGNPCDDFLGTIAEGEVFTGTVRTVVDYGVFIEVAPGVDGLLHVSNRVDNERVYKKGERVQVQLFNIDTERKRVQLNEIGFNAVVA